MGSYQKTIDMVNKEISEMGDEHRMTDFPTDVEEITSNDLPAEVKEFFLTLLADNIRRQKAVREADGEVFNPKEEIELSFRWGTYKDADIYWMGIHMPSPFNALGYDFYVLEDGQFVGWSES